MKKEPTSIFQRTSKKCIFCGKDTAKSMISFHNTNGNDKDFYGLLKKDEACCFECYIEECVQEAIKKHLK